MKKRLLPLALILCCALTACDSNFMPTKREIEDFEMVQVLGIDKCSEHPSSITATIVSRAEQASAANGIGTKIVTVSTASGFTIFDALRSLKAHSDKMVFFAHIEYIIIGEGAAKEDIWKYFDVILRDSEIRLTPRVFIAKDCSVRDLLRQTSSSDKYIVERLDNIEYDLNYLSKTDQINVRDAAVMLIDPQSAAVIPALESADIHSEHSTGEMPEREIRIAGYAVFKDFKLVGYLEDTFARGYNFLTNKVGSSPVTVIDPFGQHLGLEVTQSETTVHAHFNGDTLEGVAYITDIQSNIEEQHSRGSIHTQQMLDEIAAAQSETIKNEMEQVLAFSIEQQIDCTGLGEQIRMRYPVKWERIKDDWAKIYPRLDISVYVRSHIIRTYDIQHIDREE